MMARFIIIATALFKYPLFSEGDPGHRPPTRITPAVDTIAPIKASEAHHPPLIITPHDEAEAPKNASVARIHTGIRINAAFLGSIH
jgi:hypothetical protein